MTEIFHQPTSPDPHDSPERNGFQSDNPYVGDAQVPDQRYPGHDDGLASNEAVLPERQIVHHRRVDPGEVGSLAVHGGSAMRKLFGRRGGLPFTPTESGPEDGSDSPN